jgi:WD40 repeat protein
VGKPLEGHTLRCHSVAYSPDGQQIISGSADRTIRIWDAKTGAVLGTPLRDTVVLCPLWHTPLMGSILSLDLMMGPSVCGGLFHSLPLEFPLVLQG